MARKLSQRVERILLLARRPRVFQVGKYDLGRARFLSHQTSIAAFQKSYQSIGIRRISMKQVDQHFGRQPRATTFAAQIGKLDPHGRIFFRRHNETANFQDLLPDLYIPLASLQPGRRVENNYRG